MRACAAFGPGWKRCGKVNRWMLVVLALTSLGSCRRTEVVPSFPDSYVGVGMELRIEDGQPVVVRTLPGGTAGDAGIERGDRIVTIDGRTTRGATLGTIVMRIRGKPESQVTFVVDRGGERIVVVVRRRKMAKRGDDYDVAPRTPRASPGH